MVECRLGEAREQPRRRRRRRFCSGAGVKLRAASVRISRSTSARSLQIDDGFVNKAMAALEPQADGAECAPLSMRRLAVS